MRLILYCDNCSHKIHLGSTAKTRRQLANQWGDFFYITCPSCGQNHQYHVNQVRAEDDTNGAVPGALIGGILGVLAGPIGMIIGATAGGAITNANANAEVNRFNNNYC